MAQKVQIILEDDLDGGEATQTVTFGLDGDQFEIDLNDANAAAMREAFARYTGAGRTTQRRRGRKPAALSQAQQNGTAKKAASSGRGRGKRTATVEAIEATKAGAKS